MKLNGDVVPQVRRMTGALVAVGRGRLSVPQLKGILEARDSLAYPQGLAAPASGLFLTRVDYRDTGEQVETEKKLAGNKNNYFSLQRKANKNPPILHWEHFKNVCLNC